MTGATLLFGYIVLALFFPVVSAMDLYALYSMDTDHDGIVDSMEERYGTNPLLIDTDGDGFTDREELFDYGTDPQQGTPRLFDEDEQARILSLPPSFRLLGDALFVKGVVKEQGNTAEDEEEGKFSSQEIVSLEFSTIHGSLQESVYADERGVFVENVDLHALCRDTDVEVQLSIDSQLQRIFTMDCSMPAYERVVSDIRLGGDIWYPGSEKEIEISEQSDVALSFQLPAKVMAHVSFHSLVTSSSFVHDAEWRGVTFVPGKRMYDGAHKVTLQLYDEKEGLLYAPLEIPFEKTPSVSMAVLSATALYSDVALLFGMSVAFSGAVYVRVLRRKMGLRSGE